MDAVYVGWPQYASCKQDPELFFPPPQQGRPAHGGQDSPKVREAKDICGSCRVKGPCLAYALKHHMPHGIWGGMTEGERSRIKRQPKTGPRKYNTRTR